MSTAVSEDAFKEALKKHQAEEKEAQERQNRDSYEPADPIPMTALEPDTEKIIRIMGDPHEVRSKPTDIRKFEYSMIQGDRNKKFMCFWPSAEDKPDWILRRVYKTVMEYTWDASANARVYHHQEAHPRLFNRVAKNDNPENRYEKGWKPSSYVAMNVIDRHDMDWHRENKALKVLSRNASPMRGGDGFFYDPGIPEYLYSVIWDNVGTFYGHWKNYDIAILRKKKSPYYVAMHCEKEREKIQDATAAALVVPGPLTEEELSWEAQNLDDMYKITSYNKIKYNLGMFFGQVDDAFGTKFLPELDELVAKEKAEREEERVEAVVTSPTPKAEPVVTTEKVTVEVDDEEPDEAPVRAPKRVARAPKEVTPEPVEIDWEGLADGTFNGTKYEGVPLLTEEEKAVIVGINEDGSFQYAPDENGIPLVTPENTTNGFMSPEFFHVCPMSGEVF